MDRLEQKYRVPCPIERSASDLADTSRQSGYDETQCWKVIIASTKSTHQWECPIRFAVTGAKSSLLILFWRGREVIHFEGMVDWPHPIKARARLWSSAQDSVRSGG